MRLEQIPGKIAQPNYSSPDWDGKTVLVAAPVTICKLGEWYNKVIKEMFGDTSGTIKVNSAYRAKGTDPVDLTDANGHWTGRAIDISTDATILSFWPQVNIQKNLWLRDMLRKSFWECGFYYPWLWKNNRLHEFWHISIELEPWTQKNAYRGNPAVRDIPKDYLDILKG